jgi:hypothetical protein
LRSKKLFPHRDTLFLNRDRLFLSRERLFLPSRDAFWTPEHPSAGEKIAPGTGKNPFCIPKKSVPIQKKSIPIGENFFWRGKKPSPLPAESDWRELIDNK